MSHKTKAAMQGRQCHYEKPKQIKHTRVNAGGQRMSQRNSAPADFIQLFSKAFSHPGRNTSCSLLPQRLFVMKHDFKRKAATIKTAAKIIIFFIAHPFGSIPCRKSSLRASAFSQLPRLTPSRLAASFSCWRSSGVIRIWKVGDRPSPFGVLSLLMVDMYVRNSLLWILLCTYVITTYVKKATPRTARTVPRRLTKPLSEVTVMADNQSTQTRPEFTWRFLSTSEQYPTAKPLVIYVNASSEQEARDTMPGVTLIFAARLPFHAFQIMEVRHV